jgi:aryl-alcohol dehydrogenase-like predicted oxidoreductase
VRTRRLGTAGPLISVTGFGAWAIGGPYQNGWGAVDDSESVAAIERAVEGGVNWIDTAPVYGLGHSEDIAGRALAALGDADVLVFTKCGRVWASGGEPIENDLRPGSIRRECEESLRRLGRDHIDLYQFHWPDWTSGTPLEESWGTMCQLVEEGKARWIGVCNFDVDQLERCQAVRRIDSVQIPLSLLARGTRATSVAWANANGAGVLAYSPMASGMLTGAFDRRRLDRLAPDDWRRRSSLFHEPELSRNLALVEALRPIADRIHAPLPALAVAWVTAQPGVTAAIVGARRPDQVEAWLAAAELELDPKTLAEIDDALAATGAGTDTPPQPPPQMTASRDRVAS